MFSEQGTWTLSKTARLQAKPRPLLLSQYLANERLQLYLCREANKTVQMGLMPRWCLLVLSAHYPSRHRHVIAKQHSCPELALISFTKPCPASWSSDHEQFCRVDFLIYPSNLGSDLCKIRCWCWCSGAAEWGLPYGFLWRYVS